MPAASLKRYRIGGVVLMEEKSEGILLRPMGPIVEKLSWEDTAREMAASHEDWGEWDVTDADGADGIPWKNCRVAELKARYTAGHGRGKQ